MLFCIYGNCECLTHLGDNIVYAGRVQAFSVVKIYLRNGKIKNESKSWEKNNKKYSLFKIFWLEQYIPLTSQIMTVDSVFSPVFIQKDHIISNDI